MPQNPRLSEVWQKELGPNWKDIHARYVHTIGNLTLTGYKAELSDRSFYEKRTIEGGFDHSTFKLNQNVAHIEHWDQVAIEKRAGILADKAMKIWTLPVLSDKQISQHSSKQGKKPVLAEIIGATNHPLAGFVPDGFRLIQSTEKRFYLFRKVEDEWIQYGNGKNSWFVTSWESVRSWILRIHQKNEMPLGIGGEKLLGTVPVPKEQGEILTDYLALESTNGNPQYTLADHSELQGEMLTLFSQLRKRILNLSPFVREEIKKHYIAYKLATNFVDVEPLKKSLYLTLNMPYEEIDDPHHLCNDVTNIGHHGNGDIAVRLTGFNQIEDVMYLIQQAFERQNEEAIA
jgi:predicted transport protein